MYFLVNYIPTKYIFENIYDIPNLERPWGKIRDVNPFLQNLLRILLIELVCFHQFIGKGIQKRIENMNAWKFNPIIVGNAYRSSSIKQQNNILCIETFKILVMYFSSFQTDFKVMPESILLRWFNANICWRITSISSR